MDARGAESAAPAAGEPQIRQRKPHDDSVSEGPEEGSGKPPAPMPTTAGGKGTWLAGDELKGLICMALLALQYALQPVVSKKFIQ